MELRILSLNPCGDLACQFGIYQRTAADSWTILGGLVALFGVGEQFRPEGEGTALKRLDRVNGTATGEKKWALLKSLLSEAQQRRSAADITPFELRASDSEVLSEARNVSAGQVNKTFLLTAADASGAALKAHGRV